MDLYEALADSLRVEEGLRLKPYRCSAGRLTIGYGHNLESTPITARAAEVILEDDIAEAVAAARRVCPQFDSLTRNRQVALANMVFQMGEAGVRTFRNTLAHIAAGRYADAAKGMLNSRWARQTPARAERMARLMEEG
jgi:lysozyme